MNRAPGAISQILPNASLVSPGNGTRKPVVLGVGDIKVLVEDEKVTRGTIAGGKDTLLHTLYDSSSVVRVGNSPGSSDWTLTTQYTVDTLNNAIDWSSGIDIGGSSTITTYGTVLTGDNVAPYNTFIATASGIWSAVDNYYVGGVVTITNPDSSNYGLTSTITSYTAATRTFITGSWLQAINVSDTFVVALEPDEPSANTEYYVTYYKALNNFSLTEYTDEASIRAAHGDTTFANGSPNKLTIGALLALRNGAPSVIVGQLNYSSWGSKLSPTVSEFNASLNLQIENLKNLVETKLYLIPMTTESTSINYVWNHCKQWSAPENKGERSCVAGSTRDASITTLKLAATSHNSTRFHAMAPSDIRFADLTAINLNGDIAAAAYAGKRCSTTRVSQSVTGDTLTGIIVDTIYNPVQQRELLGAGCLVLTTSGGVVTILHDKTSNPSTADTEETSVIEVADYLNRRFRDELWAAFKGAPIDANLPSTMLSKIASLCEQEIRNQNITGYKEFRVQQDLAEPRRVLIYGKVAVLYNTVWIDITLQQYV